MKIISLINAHNSFTILTLCELISKKYGYIENYSVTNKQFYLRYNQTFKKQCLNQ